MINNKFIAAALATTTILLSSHGVLAAGNGVGGKSYKSHNSGMGLTNPLNPSNPMGMYNPISPFSVYPKNRLDNLSDQPPVCDAVCVARTNLDFTLKQPPTGRFSELCQATNLIGNREAIAQLTATEANTIRSCLDQKNFEAILSARTPEELKASGLKMPALRSEAKALDYVAACKSHAANSQNFLSCYAEERIQGESAAMGAQLLGGPLLIMGGLFGTLEYLDRRRRIKAASLLPKNALS